MRDVKFIDGCRPGIREPTEQGYALACSVLEAIVRWLGYGSDFEYAEACSSDPAEVRRRLKEAK